MDIQKIVLSARDNLIILDERKYWCRRVGGFLSEKLREAGSIKTLHTFAQSHLEFKLFNFLHRRFPDHCLEAGGMSIFPGRSAERIRKHEEKTSEFAGAIFNKSFLSIHAERRFIGSGNPVVTVGEIWPEQSVCPKIHTIVVVDDVISSGSTCRKLYERNKQKFPRAEWYACACASRLEKIVGYREVITPLLIPIDTFGLKVPINSLSTLIEEKATVGKEYAYRHCTKPEVFLCALDVVIDESQDFEHYHMDMMSE